MSRNQKFNVHFFLNKRRKKGVKVFEIVSKSMCLNTPGLWSHANVNSSKNDISPQEELVEMLLGI